MTSVYLIQAGETNNFKIGISNNPQLRLSNIQTSHYEKLVIVKSVEYPTRFIALSVEEFLHGKYKKDNTLGEWFTFDDYQIEEIEKYLDNEVSEVIFLKAKIKELEQQLRENNPCEPLTKSISPKPTNRVSRLILNRDDLISKIFKGLEAKGDKVPPKQTLVNTKHRSETKIYETTMRELKDIGIVDYQRGKGYFLAVGKESAMHILHEDEQPFKEV